MRKSKKSIIILSICIMVIVFAGGIFVLHQYIKCEKDISRLKEDKYDTVFFSMYPTEYYDEADYKHFRGMEIVKTSYAIPDTRMMEWYMDVAVKSGNIIHTAYLGIDPERAGLEDVRQIVLENQDIMFEIVLAYPRMEYWLEMEDAQWQDAVNSYREFAGEILGYENVRVYYFGNAEWLLCNPGNYADTFITNEEVSMLLMCNSDEQHPYMLNVENFHDRFHQAERLIEKYRNKVPEYIDASDWEIVFFGDSVIGNYTDSLSIPGVVNGLTDAVVYNCGYGGKSAALSERTQEPLPVIVDAFTEKNLKAIPEETQVYAGIEQYIQDDINRPEAEAGTSVQNKTLFVINHGLNDYFDGLAVESKDAYDISSYSGAIRVAVKKIQAEYPQAEILLITPNLSINFDYGQGVQSEEGGRLGDYADALIRVAEELDVAVLDNFRELPIEKERYWEFLADGTHPNEQGRFIMGVRIVEKLETMITE